MEMVESIIRSGPLRRRSQRSLNNASTESISIIKPLRSLSLRSSSVPHRVRNKTDLARAFMPTAQYDSLSEVETPPPNLDQLRPMSYEEFYASCDAMSSKSSATALGRDPEEFSSCLVPEEKHGECTADASMVTLEPGITPGLQPSMPSAVAFGPFANLPFSADPPTGSPASAEEPLAVMPEADSVEEMPSNIVPAVPQAANVVRRKLTGYVGFANLPNQWHRKSVRKGFNFNVMVVGECWVCRSCIRRLVLWLTKLFSR